MKFVSTLILAALLALSLSACAPAAAPAPEPASPPEAMNEPIAEAPMETALQEEAPEGETPDDDFLVSIPAGCVDEDADAACEPLLSCAPGDGGLETPFNIFTTRDLSGKNADEGALDQGAEIAAVLVWDAADPEASRAAVKTFNEYVAMGDDYIAPLALALNAGDHEKDAKAVAKESGLRTLLPTEEMQAYCKDSAGKVLLFTAWGDSLFEPVAAASAEELRDQVSLVYFANFVSGCCG